MKVNLMKKKNKIKCNVVLILFFLNITRLQFEKFIFSSEIIIFFSYFLSLSIQKGPITTNKTTTKHVGDSPNSALICTNPSKISNFFYPKVPIFSYFFSNFKKPTNKIFLLLFYTHTHSLSTQLGRKIN